MAEKNSISSQKQRSKHKNRHCPCTEASALLLWLSITGSIPLWNIALGTWSERVSNSPVPVFAGNFSKKGYQWFCWFSYYTYWSGRQCKVRFQETFRWSQVALLRKRRAGPLESCRVGDTRRCTWVVARVSPSLSNALDNSHVRDETRVGVEQLRTSCLHVWKFAGRNRIPKPRSTQPQAMQAEERSWECR